MNLAAVNLQKMLEGKIFGNAPELDLDVEQKRQHKFLTAIRAGLVASAHDLSEGGLAVALAESLFGTSKLGAKVNISGNLYPHYSVKRNHDFYYPSNLKIKRHLKQLLKTRYCIGAVTDDNKLVVAMK